MSRRAFLKFSLNFLLIILLFYRNSSIKVASFLQFSSEFRTYPPLNAPGGPSGSVNMYLPIVLKYHYTTSLYFDTVDPNVMSTQGCDLANQLAAIGGEQDSAVIIDFCQPWVSSGVPGVLLCDSREFARISYSETENSVEKAARSFAEAFYSCSYYHPDTLVMVIGTNNFGDYVSRQHGIEWANMVNRVNTWLIDRGYFYRVQAVGGSDMELGYNSYATTSAWVDGYENTNLYFLHDYGDAQGCPTERSQYNGLCGGQTYQWYQSQVWDISYNESREAFPLVYNELGTNARQWYSLSSYSFVFHGSKMPIFGAVTQHQACLDGRSGCAGTDNTPIQGFGQLKYWLNQDPDTAHDPRWSTDFRHHYDMPH